MVIIASDTVVDLDGKVLEKPKNKADAYQMIKSLLKMLPKHLKTLIKELQNSKQK
jgi:predicted house-cleaning NTP pyrophosphatase (Maf/HAM1 superfamily)